MRRSIIGIVLLLSCVSACFAQRHEDTEQLGHALEYFSSGKYHEALLIFQKLDKDYKLNARFRAYIGLCYYYDWDYKNATKYLDEMIPQLGSLSPHELSVYYYANAESHFTLQEYEAAIPLFEGVLVNGFERDKGDAFYRLGFCYYLLGETAESKNDTTAVINYRSNALDNFTAAISYYRQYRNTADLEARLTQTQKMCDGLNAYLRQQSTKEEDPSPTE